MKRLIGLMAALLVLVGAASWLPAGMPVESALRSPVQTASTDLYAAENNDLMSRVYQLRGGKLTGLVRLPRLSGGRSSEITQLAAWQEQVYLLRQWDDGQLELLTYGDPVRSLRTDSLPSPGTVTGLTATADTFYLTTVAENGDVQVYALRDGAQPVLEQLLPAPAIGQVLQARYDGKVIRAALNTGETCTFSASGQVTLLDEPYGPEVTMPHLSLPQWLLCKQHVLLGAGGIWLALALTVGVLSLISHRAKRLSTRLTAFCGGTLLLALAAAYGALLGWAISSRGLAATAALVKPVAITLGCLWLLALWALRLLTRQQTKPIAQMRAQMARIADGNLTVQSQAPDGRDELRLLHQSMQELCMSLSIRDYEIDSTVRSYERFVPRDLTRLLKRANVSEISYGDSQRLEGCVGLFAVCNRDEARTALDDTSFCAFVDHSYELLELGMQTHQGALLSGGLHLSSMEVLFPDASLGARAGLQFLGQAKTRSDDAMPAPELFLLLHKTSFLYGVSGSREKLFPYLSSSELEYLGRFTPQFHKAGVKVVATERCRAALDESGLLTRYIGFISAADGNGAHKLYEVLSAYPDVERNLRMRYDQRFQEALVLFYRDDFYLARNLFSALLRACPEDGVVRWYLFACEHFFHQDAGSHVNYQLFGISE